MKIERKKKRKMAAKLVKLEKGKVFLWTGVLRPVAAAKLNQTKRDNIRDIRTRETSLLPLFDFLLFPSISPPLLLSLLCFKNNNNMEPKCELPTLISYSSFFALSFVIFHFSVFF